MEVWDGSGKGWWERVYRMSPSEMQYDGDTKMQSIGQ